jgi:hypothetical protein
MPKIKKRDIERACWMCRFYKIIVPKQGRQGGPFCRYHNKFFPNPFGWSKNDGSKKPGMRLCKNWEVK